MKNIAVLGSTGSVGLSTLQIVRTHPKKFRVRALAAKKNAAALLEQAREFRPDLICIYESARAWELEQSLKGTGIRVVTGDEGLCEASTIASAELVLFALVGAIGLVPLFAALQARKSVAILRTEVARTRRADLQQVLDWATTVLKEVL